MRDKYSVEKDNLIVDELLAFDQEKRPALAMIRIDIATFIVSYPF